MQRRPLALFLSALLFAYFPASLVYRHFEGTGVPWFEWVLLGGLPLALMAGLVHVSRVGWYTLIALVSILGIRDLYEYYEITSRSLVPLAVHLAIYTASLAYFINPRIRRLYFDPKMRWWRTKPRTEANQSVLCYDGSQWTYPVLRDLSPGGCFLESGHLMSVGTQLELTIPFPFPVDLSVLKTAGQVRWVSPNPLRRGYGVQFDGLSSREKRALRKYIRTL